METMNIVFVIPVHDERDSLRELVGGIGKHVAPHEYRIVLVDDGSTDGSHDEMLALREENPRVDVIRFHTNRGKTAALMAGIARAQGDILFTMDGDLQDDPEEIPRFLEMLDEGWDLVTGWKQSRNDPWHKVLPSRVYNHATARLFGLDLHDVNCGFKAMRMDVAREFDLRGDMHRLIPVWAAARGWRVTELPVRHHPRRHGRSKYGLERFGRGAADVLTAWVLLRCGNAPGHALSVFGFVGILKGLLLLAVSVASAVAGWSAIGWVFLALAVVALTASWVFVGIGLAAEIILQRLPTLDESHFVIEEHVGPDRE